MQAITSFMKSAVLLISMTIIAPLLLSGCGSGGDSGTRLTKIAVTSATGILTVAKGQEIRLIATGTYSDNSTADITSKVTWVSSASSYATINSGTGRTTGIAQGDTYITASTGGITSPAAKLTVSAAVLTAINITPVTKSTLQGTTVTYTAVGTFSDGSTGVASSINWSSSDTAVASIDTNGVASALAQGNTVINASSNGILSNNATLTVDVLASIAINPATATVAAGLNTRFTAIGTYTDNSTADITSKVVWATDNTAVATIDSSTGIATGKTVGNTLVTASANGITSTAATLIVNNATLSSIAITPATQSTPKGTSVTFTATGTFTDASTANISGSVTWASTNTKVATINGSGVASTLAQGTTNVSASLMGIASNSAALTVNAPALTAISINPNTASVANGLSTNFTATGTYTDGTTANITTQTTWATGNTGIATIISGTGVATGKALGSTTVTATIGGIASPSATLTVINAVLTGISITPAAQSTPKGTPVTFTATGTYSDGSTANASGQVKWSSTNTAVATLSSSGVASSLTEGKTTISASLNGIPSNDAILTVTAPALTAISINPNIASVPKGLTTSFTATGSYTDGTTANITTQATWTTGNASIATIDSSTGVATAGLTVASTTVTASADGITSPSASLSVIDAVLSTISITPTAPSTPKGTPVTFTATGAYSDGSSANISGSVSWASSDTAVATLDTSGIASSLTQGSTSITASTGGISSNTATLSVTVPVLATLTITSPSSSITLGNTLQFTAIPVLTDGTAGTDPITWNSSNPAVATVDGNGLVTTKASGTTNISATSAGITSNISELNVSLAASGGVFAVASTGQLTLSWEPVAGATSYNIYYGTASGNVAPYTKITGVTSPYPLTGLTDGQTYYYRIGAVSAAGETLSAEAFSYLYIGGNPAGAFDTSLGTLLNARVGHNATRLANGKVLITGGTSVAGTLANSEIFDPLATTSKFTATGSLQTARAYATDTLLNNGKILIIGGNNNAGSFATAELYNPATASFDYTGSMAASRTKHTATLLANGKILVTGGWSGTDTLGTAELYDPSTGLFSSTGSMANVRHSHTATLLPSGQVLVTGGCNTGDCATGSDIASAELYDPTTGSFTATGIMGSARHSHTATLMANGKVFIAGGKNFTNNFDIPVSETYNPASSTFTQTAIMMNEAGTARDDGLYHTALLLSNGKVIIMPCGCGSNPTGAHLYDPVTNAYTLTGTSNGIHEQKAVLLNNGNILVTGGVDSPTTRTPSNDAEYFY